MKKPVRDISVKRVKYVWQVANHEDESGIPYNKLRIWKDRKIIIIKNFAKEDPITPALVREQINKYENTL